MDASELHTLINQFWPSAIERSAREPIGDHEWVPFKGAYVVWRPGAASPTAAQVDAKLAEWAVLKAQREDDAKWSSFRRHRAKLFREADWAFHANRIDAPGAVEQQAWKTWKQAWLDATRDHPDPETALKALPAPPRPLYVE